MIYSWATSTLRRSYSGGKKSPDGRAMAKLTKKNFKSPLGRREKKSFNWVTKKLSLCLFSTSPLIAGYCLSIWPSYPQPKTFHLPLVDDCDRIRIQEHTPLLAGGPCSRRSSSGWVALQIGLSSCCWQTEATKNKWTTEARKSASASTLEDTDNSAAKELSIDRTRLLRKSQIVLMFILHCAHSLSLWWWMDGQIHFRANADGRFPRWFNWDAGIQLSTLRLV